ncbi:hypothetical protein MTO96_042631 [Rhipicephalus appendiculatus]
MRANVLLKQLKQKIVHDGGARTTPPARPGDYIYARNFRSGPTWLPARVTELPITSLRSFCQTVGVGGAIKNTCGRTSSHVVRLLDYRLSDRLLHRHEGDRLCNKLRQPLRACRNRWVCNRLCN